MNYSDKKLYPVLGETVRDCRLYLEMSVSEFATKMGRTPSFVRKLEQAQVEFTIGLVNDCAQSLDISVEELFELASGEYQLAIFGDCENTLAEAV